MRKLHPEIGTHAARQPATAVSPTRSPSLEGDTNVIQSSLSVSPTQLQTVSPASLPPPSPNADAAQEGSPNTLPSILPGITKLSTNKRSTPEESDNEEMDESSIERPTAIARIEEEPPTTEKEVDEAEDMLYPPEMRKQIGDNEADVLRKWELKQKYDAERAGQRTAFNGQFHSKRQKKALAKQSANARLVAGRR